MNASHKFAYFTGSNRHGERPMIETLIRSARVCGVHEDFHVFHTEDVAGAVNHRIETSFPWKNHMGKLDLLTWLGRLETDADYFCWLDTDNYFVRDPGDLSDLIRDNPIWVSMEGELTSPKRAHGDWWEMRFNTTPSIIDVMREWCVGRDTIWSTNGGMWICRRDSIADFVRSTYAVWDRLKERGYPRMSDEPPLAIVGQTMVPDPENNAIARHWHTWACDWVGRHRERLPDQTPWLYRDWTTQTDMAPISPAIVHNMRGKHLMAPVLEAVGSRLADVIKECGISQSPTCGCRTMRAQMDQWGIAGCRRNRPVIVSHLNDAAKGTSWLDMTKVAIRGYRSTEALLDEAIKRAA